MTGIRLRALALLSVALLLSGCSYTYTVLAQRVDGQIVFVLDPDTPATDCWNEISVVAENREQATPAPGDDAARIGYGTFWHERASHRCENAWPIRYGVALKGGPAQGGTQDKVSAKALRPGIIYTVNTTSGSTGYGGGRFIIRPDGSIENLKVD